MYAIHFIDFKQDTNSHIDTKNKANQSGINANLSKRI